MRQWEERGYGQGRKKKKGKDTAKAFEKKLARLDTVEKPWRPWQLQLELAPVRRGGDVVARLEQAASEHGRFRLGPIDLELRAGDRLAILGPNGAGKTTLVRALLGEMPLAEGRRWIGPSALIGELPQGEGPVLQRSPAARNLLRREQPPGRGGPGVAGEVRAWAPTMSSGPAARSPQANAAEPRSHSSPPAASTRSSSMSRPTTLTSTRSSNSKRHSRVSPAQSSWSPMIRRFLEAFPRHQHPRTRCARQEHDHKPIMLAPARAIAYGAGRSRRRFVEPFAARSGRVSRGASRAELAGTVSPP